MNVAHEDAANSLYDMSTGIPIPQFNTLNQNLQMHSGNVDSTNVRNTNQTLGLRIHHRTESVIGQSGSVSSVTTGSNNTTLTKAVDICNEINCERDCELTLSKQDNYEMLLE